MMTLGVKLAEQGWVPDSALRLAIRNLIGARARSARQGLHDGTQAHFMAEAFAGPLAIATDAANEQHYEVPAAFYERVLGPNLKYSCGLYPTGAETLGEAESAMLALTCERAGIENGMTILELGCGWGSLTCYMARHFPASRIVAISNSHSQRAHIEARAAREGLANIRVITADINDFQSEARFDRVVSVEMFEHLRNHKLLFERMSQWLEEDGKIFVHIFCHEAYAYPYISSGPGDWMAEHFFTGGMMPSFDWLPQAATGFALEEAWKVNGQHYARTCEDWLARQDRQSKKVTELFDTVYGPGQGTRWHQRWRMFFMACAELFRYNDGESWYVAHYRFGR